MKPVQTSANCCGWVFGGLVGAALIMGALLARGYRGWIPVLGCLGGWLLVFLIIMVIDFTKFWRSLPK